MSGEGRELELNSKVHVLFILVVVLVRIVFDEA